MQAEGVALMILPIASRQGGIHLRDRPARGARGHQIPQPAVLGDQLLRAKGDRALGRGAVGDFGGEARRVAKIGQGAATGG